MKEMVVMNEARMTSSEIAELVGKRHDNVKRTIETLVKNGVIQSPQIEEIENKQSLGPRRFSNAYIFEGEQGKRDSIVVVAQLCPEFTARLVDRWMELEEQIKQLAAPQQQTQLIPGTPEHFAACYRAYFGEPVLPSLTAQQQHTEPVAIAAPQREHFPAPRDMITISEVREKYFNNKDVLMQLIVSFGVRSELHHYGYTPDLSAPMNDGLIYDRRQLLAILAALRATSHPLRVGGKFFVNPALPEMKFTFKRVPTLRDGITADDITSAVEVLLLMK